MSFYSLFSEYYELIFPFRPLTFSFLAEYLNKGNMSVLDIGCGTGHYSGRFAETGASVLGIDLDEKMITYAQEQYPAADFSCLNMIELVKVSASFNLAFSIGNVLSHLDKPSTIKFLSNVRAKLNKNGYWIFQVVNWDYLLRRSEFEFPLIKVVPEKLVFKRRYKNISAAGVRFLTQLEAAGAPIFSDEARLYPATSEEYISWHSQAGFKLAGHYSDYKKTDFKPGQWSGSIFVFSAE